MAVFAAAAVSGILLYQSGVKATTSKAISTENNMDSAATPDYDAILEEFNAEHGTSYQIATDEQTEAIGGTVEERDSFIQSMSEDDFRAYLNELYESESENIIESEPYVEDDSSVKTVTAKRVDELGLQVENVTE